MIDKVYLGSESWDSDFGKDTIDSKLRKDCLNRGYKVSTESNNVWRRTDFYAIGEKQQEKQH